MNNNQQREAIERLSRKAGVPPESVVASHPYFLCGESGNEPLYPLGVSKGEKGPDDSEHRKPWVAVFGLNAPDEFPSLRELAQCQTAVLLDDPRAQVEDDSDVESTSLRLLRLLKIRSKEPGRVVFGRTDHTVQYRRTL